MRESLTDESDARLRVPPTIWSYTAAGAQTVDLTGMGYGQGDQN